MKNKSKTLVIPLAGLGSRFINKGYKIPKYILPFPDKGGTILSSILNEFNLNESWFVVVVMRSEHKIFESIVLNILGSLKCSYKINFIDKVTKGQAESVFIALEGIDENSQLWIHNGDTILKERILKFTDEDCIIDCFNSSSNSFSYVGYSKNNSVNRLVEKEVISNDASTGLYGFKSVKLYKKNYLITDWLSYNKEWYISSLINFMLKNRYVAKSVKNNIYNTILLGTPDEYENYIKNEKHI